MNTMKLAVREFALPCPRVGSIDATSGYGPATLQGIEIHQRVQSERKEDYAHYRAEVKSAHVFTREGRAFAIEGRMDGIFDPIEGEGARIEEIKSGLNIYELSQVLAKNPLGHPYGLQLLTYGYFYHQEHGRIPELSFHLVSTRRRESLDLTLELDLETYESWLERRLAELVEEAKIAEKREARRRAMAAELEFPFERPRTGQRELIESIEKGIASKLRMLVQAPTGMGKTVGVLYPSLKEALARGQRVIYATPKNSQHAVAENAIEMFQEKGVPLRALTLTAKKKMCFKAEPLCNPKYCEFARDYYTKVAEQKLLTALAKKKKLTARVFKKMGEEYEVCPFELQLDAAANADVVICDYNYVFSTTSALKRVSEFSVSQEGKPNLVIDEAHNLPSRAMGYFSPALSSAVLESMRKDLAALPGEFAETGVGLLEDCLEIVRGCRPENSRESQAVQPPLEKFSEQDLRLNAFLSKYLNSDAEVLPRDPVLGLCFYWGEFTEVLASISGGEHPEFFCTYQPWSTGDGGTLKITCCDASEMLKGTYSEYQNVVGFSATLKPFDYYSRLSGLEGESLETVEFASPFSARNRKLLIIPQVSTKYSDRQQSSAKIAEVVRRVAELKPGNHFVFFPSFEFMELVFAQTIAPAGFRKMKQERQMSADQIEEVLEHLKSEREPTLFFAVQGGVFSEGVDYPGNMILGAFIVGPPLPQFDLERRLMRDYYEKVYRSGQDYAYTFPAMAKAVQAAGRVIRTEADRGVIVLMDPRFLQPSYSKSMPADWFRESPHELVSQRILEDISGFWKTEGS